MKITKNEIVGEGIIVCVMHSEKTEQPSYLWCDRIEYMADKEGEFFDHHLMFYIDKKLVFKVWLRNNSEDKKYKDVKEAMESAGLEVLK